MMPGYGRGSHCPLFPSAPRRFFAPAVGTAGTASQPPISASWVPLPSLRLPRLPWRRRCSNEFLIGESFAEDVPCGPLEPHPVISFAGIVPEGFFVQIPEQMEGLDVNVGALDGPLQEAPEVLNAVGVNLPVNVPFGMVDDAVNVVVSEIVVGLERVGVDFGTRSNVLGAGRIPTHCRRSKRGEPR